MVINTEGQTKYVEHSVDKSHYSCFPRKIMERSMVFHATSMQLQLGHKNKELKNKAWTGDMLSAAVALCIIILFFVGILL